MLKVNLTKRASKYLSILQQKYAIQIATKIQLLRHNPEPNDSQHLKGYAPFRRTDVGEYRIIYFVEDSTLNIVLIGKRNDDEVYKKFKRIS